MSGTGRGNSRRRSNQSVELEGAIKSVDGGQSWVSINEGLPPGNRGSTELKLLVDAHTPMTLYASPDRGLFKSVDGGGHWSATGLQVAVKDVAQDPAGGATLYAASNGEVGDAFVAKLNSTGSGLHYSTYLGGQRLDEAYGIAVDSAGNAWVVGYTWSIDFPTTSGAVSTSLGSVPDAFIAKLGSEGNVLQYSSYLGGSERDFVGGINGTGGGIAIDPDGNVYVAGNTRSPDFPLKNPLQDSLAVSPSGLENMFVAKITGTGASASDGPNVTGAEVVGKKLIVKGERFAAGSTILINGQPQPTSIDSQSSGTRLVSKKGGKKIKPGEGVMIQVKNPDGVMSNAYRFVKPTG